MSKYSFSIENPQTNATAMPESANFKNRLSPDLELDFIQKKNIYDSKLQHLATFKLDETLNIKDKPCSLFFFSEDCYGVPNFTGLVSNEGDLGIQPGDSIQIPKYQIPMIVTGITSRETFFIVELKHPIFFALHQTKFKVFQKKKLSEIVIESCKEINVNCSVQSPKQDIQYELMIRYNESLMNFLNRMCFLMGCYWKYDQDGIIIAPLDIISQQAADFDEDKDIYKFINFTQRIEKTGGRITSYDSQNPQADLSSSEDSDFNYHELFLESFSKQPEGAILLDFFKNSYESEVITFQTNYKQLRAFDKISIRGKDYYVTKFEHYCGLISANDAKNDLESFYVEAKQTVHFRDFIQPIASSQFATVVLPESGATEEEIFMDDQNRVVINLHFDKDNSIVFAPVVQANSFNNHGTFFIPRVNTQVLVDFLNGDPNKPIVVGCVYNSDNANPFAIEECGWNLHSIGSQTRENIMTMSVMHDDEFIKMHTPKDIKILSNEGELTLDMNAELGSGGDITITMVNGDYSLTIQQGDKTITIAQGNMDITVSDVLNITAKTINITALENYTEIVGQNKTITIQQDEVCTILANRTETIGANLTQTIGANATQTIAANLTSTIGANATITAAANTTITTAANWTNTVGANSTETIGAMWTQTVGGMGTQTIASGLTQFVGGPLTVQAVMIAMTSTGVVTIISQGAVMINAQGVVMLVAQGPIMATGAIVMIAAQGLLNIVSPVTMVVSAMVSITGGMVMITSGVIMMVGNGVLAGMMVPTSMFGIGFLIP